MKELIEGVSLLIFIICQAIDTGSMKTLLLTVGSALSVMEDPFHLLVGITSQDAKIVKMLLGDPRVEVNYICQIFRDRTHCGLLKE